MKTRIGILLLSLALVVMQACGPSSKKEEGSADLAAASSVQKQKTLAERQARIEKERDEMQLKRRAAREKLMSSSPYYKLPNGRLVYYQTETAPSFIGGDKAMNKFLEDNLTYPAGPEYSELDGTVFVDFVVSADGTVHDSEVTSYTYDNVDPVFTEEALRVVKMMPRWSPGRQNGEAVDVRFSVPITFRSF
ncbi:MAG: energy transducer TonB [Cytophagales bacterium]|nr:energy transducer TonB [Cytophagales bacterium]